MPDVGRGTNVLYEGNQLSDQEHFDGLDSIARWTNVTSIGGGKLTANALFKSGTTGWFLELSGINLFLDQCRVNSNAIVKGN